MSHTRATALCLCVFGVFAAGCDVRWPVRGAEASRGPVTSATNPAGVPASALVGELAVVDAREVDFVEQVLTHRANYHRALRQLHDYYWDGGYITKQSWAKYELDGLEKVKAFRYVLDAEVPRDALTPTSNIAEADALYDQARQLMAPPDPDTTLPYGEEVMVRAAGMLRRLIVDYPDSDKIDDAAFYLGELHANHLRGQEAIAVRWYQRAWEWNAATPHPARYRAARVYDYRLHDRERALELYRGAIEHESAYKANIRIATRRINELTKGIRTAGARP